MSGHSHHSLLACSIFLFRTFSMQLLSKSQEDFRSLTTAALDSLHQVTEKLESLFEAEFALIETGNKRKPSYFNSLLQNENVKPVTLLKNFALKSHVSNPFPFSNKSGLAQTKIAEPPSSQPQPGTSELRQLKRTRSDFASSQTYLGDEGPKKDNGMIFLDASPPSVRVQRTSQLLTPQSPRVPKEQHKMPTLNSTVMLLKEEDQYSLTEYSETDVEKKTEQDERRRKRRAKKRVPTWCKDWQYMAKMQRHVDPDGIFMTLQAFAKCDLKKIFDDKDKSESTGRSAKKHRGSSGNWGVDGLTDNEIANYKKLMGQMTGEFQITSINSSKLGN
jgi:hypothetical protein